MADSIDIAAHIGATTRTVSRGGRRDGQAVHTVVAERTFDTTVDDLWDAISTKERIERWFMPITGDLKLGGRYKFEANAGGEITACEPPAHLAATWEYNDDVSWVDVRISAVADGTRLVLTHAARPTPEWEERGFGPGAVGIGWESMMLGLALHVTGAGMEPAEAAAWQTTPDAMEFMRRSSAGWCDADIASGTPADEARAAAQRTIDAYTGG